MGNNTNKTIELNGRRYDAATGALVERAARPTPKSRGVSVDGFIRTSRSASVQKLVATPAVKPAASPAVAVHRAAKTPVSIVPHSPQKATTLMRSAVKKPVIKSAAVIKSTTRTDLLAHAPVHTVVPKLSSTTINPSRKHRAVHMTKHPAVEHYAPQPAHTPQHQARPAQPRTRVQSPRIAQPYRTSGQPQPAKPLIPLPIDRQRSTPTRTGRPTRSVAATTTGTPDIFQEALAAVLSHEQSYQRQPRRSHKRLRAVGFTAAGLFLIVALGFIGYRSIPQLSVKVASYRAGLHAKLPASEPAGFKFGHLDYQPGNVTANFTSPTDGRQFNIIQKPSNWDSQALLSNFVTGIDSAYKTYQRAGRTVYVLSNSTATWVDSGIWYTVDGNASLSPSQLLDVASSM